MINLFAKFCFSTVFSCAAFNCANAQSVEFIGDWANFIAPTNPPVALDTFKISTLPNSWSMLQEKSPGRISVQQDPTSPSGRMVAHVLVEPGDNLGYTGERAEVSYMLGASGQALPVNATTPSREYYAFSVKLVPGWQSPGRDPNGSTWGVVLQLHSPDVDDAPPAIAIKVQNDFHLSLDGGDLLAGGALTSYRQPVDYPLSDGSLMAGQWVEFVLNVRWSTGPYGSIIVSRRNPGKWGFTTVLSVTNVATLQSVHGIDPGAHYHYWKTGFYRSATPGLTSELWLGPLVRGTDIVAVENAAF